MVARRTLGCSAWLVLAALPLAFEVGSEARQTPPAPAASAEFFEARVRPVLAANCYDCHAEDRLGGLRLDSREGMLNGGASGPALVPGDPDKSLIIRAVRQSGALKMPKGGRLTPDEVEALTAWVRAGAAWPVSAVATPAAASAPPAGAPSTAAKPAAPAYVITPAQRAFWSFQPLRMPRRPIGRRQRSGRRPTSIASSSRGWRAKG